MEVVSVMRVAVVMVCCVLLTAAPTSARPPLRQKRVSDQRLAELETLLALAKMEHRKYGARPVGFGLVDVRKIGRRKRSSGELARALDQYYLGELLSSGLNRQVMATRDQPQDYPNLQYFSSYPSRDVSLPQEAEEEQQEEEQSGEQPSLRYRLHGEPHRVFN